MSSNSNPAALRRRVANSGLRNFIEKITARPREARMWLKYFRRSTEPDQAFAVLQLAKDVLRDTNMLGSFYWQLAFLHQNGLKPALVLDGSSDGDIQQVLSGLLEHGVTARILEPPANAVQVRACLLEGHLPLVNAATVEVERSTELLPCTAALGTELQPLKVMLLNSEQGLVDCDSGQVLGDIVLPSDLDRLRQTAWFGGSEHEKRVQRIAALLECLPHESSVIVTRADTVIQELFTHHGVGTMLRRTDKIIKHSSLQDVSFL